MSLADIDYDTGQLRVWSGKGGKERFVPFSRSAKRAVWQYTKWKRRRTDEREPVFLSEHGSGAGALALSPRNVALLIARLDKRANIPPTKRCSPTPTGIRSPSCRSETGRTYSR